MEKVLVILISCIVISKVVAFHKVFDKIPCTEAAGHRRNELVEEAKCGKPKDVFVLLKPTGSYEEIYPGGVWVKRCIGVCEHEGSSSKCVNAATGIKKIPVRIYNVATNKETCSLYPVEEDITCACYDGGCAEPPEDFGT